MWLDQQVISKHLVRAHGLCTALWQDDIIAQQMMQSNSNGINPSWPVRSLKVGYIILQQPYGRLRHFTVNGAIGHQLGQFPL